MKIPTVMLSMLEKAINHYLALDPVSIKRLAVHSGKTVAVDVRGPEMVFYIGITNEGVLVFNKEPDVVDTRLLGSPVALMKMGISSQPEETENILFSGDVKIEGDIELGQELKIILNEIEPDFEERLSEYTGDVIAHQVGNLFRAGKRWGGRSVETLEQDMAEYLQEETGQLPVREEVDAFLSGVDSLRSDVDRMEARVRRLQAFLSNSSGDSPGEKQGQDA